MDMDILINDTKVVIEKRSGEVLTIETYSEEAAQEMAKSLAIEFMTRD